MGYSVGYVGVCVSDTALAVGGVWRCSVRYYTSGEAVNILIIT
jgi:hypothetical protein